MLKKLDNKMKLAIKKKYKKKYENLLKERFNGQQISIDEEDEPVFFNNLLEIIKEQYNYEIDEKASGDDGETKIYKQNEKIRLEIKIKELEMDKSDLKYAGNIFSIIFPMFTFALGNMIGFANQTSTFLINHRLNYPDITQNEINVILDEFKKFSFEINDILMTGMKVSVIIATLGIISLEILHKKNTKTLCVNRTFNRYCLQALNSIKENEVNI